MAFDHETPAIKKKSSTDEMVALGHMAGSGPVKRTGTRKIEKKLPSEARRGLLIALGVIVVLALVAFLRTRA
jgi:hypothetical protein